MSSSITRHRGWPGHATAYVYRMKFSLCCVDRSCCLTVSVDQCCALLRPLMLLAASLHQRVSRLCAAASSFDCCSHHDNISIATKRSLMHTCIQSQVCMEFQTPHGNIWPGIVCCGCNSWRHTVPHVQVHKVGAPVYIETSSRSRLQRALPG